MPKTATPRGVADGQADGNTEQTATRAGPDWETIECEYRAGLFSIREIGKRNGVSDTAIRKKAKAGGWARDLTSKVQEQVRADLVRAQVRTEVRTTHTRANPRTEREIVEEAAATVVAVVQHHRKDIKAGREVVAALLAQLASSDMANAEIEELIEQETAIAEDDTTATEQRKLRRRAAMLKAISLPERAGTIKELSLALKNLIGVERQAYNVDATPPPPPPGEDDRGAIDTFAAFRDKLQASLDKRRAATGVA